MPAFGTTQIVALHKLHYKQMMTYMFLIIRSYFQVKLYVGHLCQQCNFTLCIPHKDCIPHRLIRLPPTEGTVVCPKHFAVRYLRGTIVTLQPLIAVCCSVEVNMFKHPY